MCGMFSYCETLTSLDLSNFDTKGVTDMNSMFSFCSSLKYLNIDNFDTRLVNNMALMFSHDTKLERLNMTSFDTHNCDFFNLMFEGCINLLVIVNQVKCENLIMWIPEYVDKEIINTFFN